MDPGPAGVGASLARAVSGTVRWDVAALDAVASDASRRVGRPQAVVRPEGIEDLVRTVEWAVRERVPLVARGGGSSLDGESVPIRGGVVVDFSGWDRILEIDPVDGIARVQPGVSPTALDGALRDHGLAYPVIPGSGPISTLGGNVATNASGPRSYRYGPTRGWVRGMTVVDGRARRWSTGGRFAKASVGPDLTGLLVGSEGTLALTAELLLRAAPRPERRTGAVLPVPDPPGLGGFVRDVARALGAEGSALEYVDAATAEALRAAGPGFGGPDGRGLLLVEAEGPAGAEGELLERIDAVARRHGVEDAVVLHPDADRMWSLRGGAGPAVERLGGPRLREDVAVPVSALDALESGVHALAARHGVEVRVFGHVGQGNLHPVFAVDPFAPPGRRLRQELLELTLRLGGTISGEHGIGEAKRSSLAAQLAPPGLEALRALKSLLDPHGILNPGKLLPDGPSGPARRSDASPSVGAAPRTPPE